VLTEEGLISVAAGMLNLASLFPILSPYIIALDVALVVLITLINLRGVRESGSILAFPTYFFVVTAMLLIIVGVIKAFVVGHQPLIGQFAPLPQTEPLTLFLLLRAFATGCSAMTGVEAISNGIPAFQKPETRNAATTLTWMAVILGALFFGITVLAMTFPFAQSDDFPSEIRPALAARHRRDRCARTPGAQAASSSWGAVKPKRGDTLIVRKRKWATFFSIQISISQQTLVCLLSQFDKRFSQRSSTILADMTTKQLAVPAAQPVAE
jgi:amino acid transporter